MNILLKNLKILKILENTELIIVLFPFSLRDWGLERNIKPPPINTLIRIMKIKDG